MWRRIKNKIMRLSLGLIFGILTIGCSTGVQIERLDGSKIDELELTNKIQALTDSAGVTGMAISIFSKGQLTCQRAFGYSNFDAKDSLRTDMVFYSASLSKAVFGYLVAQLAEEGIIDLDTPLQKYLDTPIPELEFEKEWRGFKALAGDKRYEDITARMCLSHTTGFPNWRWISRTGAFQPEGKLYFYFDPGTQYSYSGEGMMLLQYTIEHITGKGLEQLARKRIFDPLHMDMTSYVWQERFENRYCHGHTADQKVIPKDKEDEAGAAGSMETTLEDYSRFVEHILKLASENSKITQLMFNPNIRIRTKAQFGPLSLEESDENDEIQLSYGLGWGLLQSPFGLGAFKEGHGEGFQHYSIIFPEKGTGVIILSNSDNAESIFKYLLEITIADIYTPWKWENYIPYDYVEPIDE
jgi:CubicO group peptidase (beta-lactamase class C family)